MQVVAWHHVRTDNTECSSEDQIQEFVRKVGEGGLAASLGCGHQCGSTCRVLDEWRARAVCIATAIKLHLQHTLIRCGLLPPDGVQSGLRLQSVKPQDQPNNHGKRRTNNNEPAMKLEEEAVQRKHKGR